MPAGDRPKRTSRTSRAQTSESNNTVVNDEITIEEGQENADVENKEEESTKDVNEEVSPVKSDEQKGVTEDITMKEKENSSNNEIEKVLEEKEIGEILVASKEEIKDTEDKNAIVETTDTAENGVKDLTEENVDANDSKEEIIVEVNKEVINVDEIKIKDKSSSDQVDASELKKESDAILNDQDKSKVVVDDKEAKVALDGDSNQQDKSKEVEIENKICEEVKVKEGDKLTEDIVSNKDNNVIEKENDVKKEYEIVMKVREQSTEPEILIIDTIASKINSVKDNKPLENCTVKEMQPLENQGVKISQDTCYLTNVEVEKLLACEICDKMCVLGIVVNCCGAQACRSCATEKLKGDKKGGCWSCKKSDNPVLFNDRDLRSAVNRFQTNSHFKTDPVVIAAIKKRKSSKIVMLKEASDLTKEQVEKLLACELCNSICFRGIVLPCCGAQACRACALKKVLADRVCWSCKKSAKSEDFQNDQDLRAAVNKFNENSTFKTDPETIAVLMARRDKKNKPNPSEPKFFSSEWKITPKKKKKNKNKNKDTAEKKGELWDAFKKSVIPGKNLKANKRFDKITRGEEEGEEGPLSDRKEVIATINRGPLVCFMIPQVMCVNARSVSVDKVGLRYQIDQEGFTGQGVIKVFDRTTKIRSVGCMIKMIPETFNKDTLLPHQLATPSGRFPEIRKNMIIGSYDGLTEQELKDIPPAPTVTQFKLVFKGAETFKVNGFKCLTAQFADKDDASKIALGSPDHFYGVSCEHEGLNIFTAAVSPFQEDDMCVRVIVIPTLKDGIDLKNGEVLGSVELLGGNGVFKVKHDLINYNQIISQLWGDQWSVKTHYSKKALESQTNRKDNFLKRAQSGRGKKSQRNVKRAVLQEEAMRLKSQGVKSMSGKPIDKVIMTNRAYSKGEKKLRKKLQEQPDGKNYAYHANLSNYYAKIKKKSMREEKVVTRGSPGQNSSMDQIKNSPSRKRRHNEQNNSAKKKGRWENLKGTAANHAAMTHGGPPPAANPSLEGKSYYDKDVERFGSSGFNQQGSYQMGGGASNYMDTNSGSSSSGMYGQGGFDYSYANNFGQGGRTETHYSQDSRSADNYGQQGRSADNYVQGGRSVDNYGQSNRSADYNGQGGRSADNYGGGGRSADNYGGGGMSADNYGGGSSADNYGGGSFADNYSRGGKSSFNPMMGSMSSKRNSGYDNRWSSDQNNYQQQGQSYVNEHAGISRERQDVENQRRELEREIMQSKEELESLRRMKGDMLHTRGSSGQHGGQHGGQYDGQYGGQHGGQHGASNGGYPSNMASELLPPTWRRYT